MSIRRFNILVWVALSLGCLQTQLLAESVADGFVLTNAASVHELAPEMADKKLPVRLEGVVTHFNRRLGNGFFVQDASDGVYVLLSGFVPEIGVGDLVRVEGETGAGDYAPVVRLHRLEKLGQGVLPPPERATAATLATGRYDSRRVQVHGIVRAATLASHETESHLALQLRCDGRDLLVGVNDYTPASTNLVDAEVIVYGVAAGVFSWRRQLIEPVVVVDSEKDIEVVSAPQQVDNMPIVTIQSLFRYSPNGFPERRVRLAGQLIGQQIGRWLAVRDASCGLFVEAPEALKFSPGDHVEMIGFPEMRGQTLWLTKARVWWVGHGTPPQPVDSSITNALRHPCELHRIVGRLTGPPRPGEGSWVLNLREDDQEFEAWLPAAGGPIPVDWREGALLAVTGITEPYFLPSHRPTMTAYPFPRGLRLHLRTRDDVRLIRAAPWWTSPRLTKTILASLVGTLLLLGLTTLAALVLARKNAALREAREQLRAARDELARRYTARTGEWQEELAARHAAEADFALLTAERTRLARELHDTLEQSLASTALHLDAAKGFFREQPAESERLLDAATQQLRQSQLEVRRSVWNLRALALEQATLPEALRHLGKALADPHGPVIEVRCEGKPRHIPPGDASHLFRVAQEGVTNALKHAKARKIEIALVFKPESVQLQINDDGCGFDPAAVSLNGHFGLRGLRERARALNAELVLDSKPGQGTRISLTVPAANLQEK